MGNVRRRQAILTLGALCAGSVLHASGLAPHVGGAVVSVPAARAQPGGAQCVLTPEQTEGPYYIDDEPFRRRISEGLPLLLLLEVQDAATCTPIPNAVVEVWHAGGDTAHTG